MLTLLQVSAVVCRQEDEQVEKKLIFDPVNRMLYDSGGQTLKHVSCPRLKSWENLVREGSSEEKQRFCDSCDRAVLDTEQMTPTEIIQTVYDDPDVCFRIQLGQNNIEIKVLHD